MSEEEWVRLTMALVYLVQLIDMRTGNGDMQQRDTARIVDIMSRTSEIGNPFDYGERFYPVSKPKGGAEG